MERDDINDFLNTTMVPPADNAVYMERGTIQDYDGTNEVVSVTVGVGINVVPNVNFFAHYIPTVGDDVFIIRVGQALMVLGKIAR